MKELFKSLITGLLCVLAMAIGYFLLHLLGAYLPYVFMLVIIIFLSTMLGILIRTGRGIFK